MKIPVTPQLLSHWENGRKAPGQQSIIRLITIFAGQLAPDGAWEWGWQAGQELSREDLQEIFPQKEVQPPHLLPTRRLQHPPLPDNYVQREELQAKILASLPPQSAHRSLVLWGEGGAGKSTLTAWAAAQLQKYFPDGVIWIPYEGVLNTQRWIAKSFAVELSEVSPSARAGELRTLLHEKRCLMIMDDVWDDPELIHLKIYNDNCPLLITTRDKTTAHVLQIPTVIAVAGLTPKEGQILLKSSDGNLNEAELQQLAAHVENLPLALVLINAQLQQGYTPTELLAALQNDPADLAILDLGSASSRDRSLNRCFDLSYSHLSSELQQRFAQLGCLTGSFTIEAAAGIWQTTNLNLTRRWLNQLTSLRLVQLDRQGFRIHRLLRDYAQQKLLANWPNLRYETHKSHAAYFVRYCLYHPQLLDGSSAEASDLEQTWGDVIAGVNWAVSYQPQLAAQAVLLAHTERPALLEEIGAPLVEAVETHLQQQVTDFAEQSVWHELLGDLCLLQNNHLKGLAHFEQASQNWAKLEEGVAAAQAKLRVAGAYLLCQDQPAAAEAARQAQALVRQNLPLTSEDTVRAERLFYWFTMIYSPLIRWEEMPEEDIVALVDLTRQTQNPLLQARTLNIYQMWCTTNVSLRPAKIREKGYELALEAEKLWREAGREDRADDEISFTRYRLSNEYSLETATRFAQRRSTSTPRVDLAQIQLFKGRSKAIYWWLKTSEEKRIEWLSWMLPRYLGTDDRPIHSSDKIKREDTRLPKLKPDQKGYRWVETILNIGALGGTGRRLMVDTQPPADHLLNGPEWRILSGQRSFALVDDAAKTLVERHLALLEAKLP